MKKIISVLLLLLLFAPAVAHGASENVYVLELSGEVSPGMLSYVKEGIEEANENGADLILLEIDTLGGRVDVAENISRLILNSKVKTVSYVNTKAESAGVLLTISANNFYMAPAATIGSAETIPNTEKALSYWRALLETTAERRGRDPKLVAAMADASLEIKDVVEKGKLLNLTSQKAEELGFSDGTMNSRMDIYEAMNIENPNEIILDVTMSNQIVGFLASSVVSQILLTIGFIGLVVEILTPGFGVGGVTAMISFALFFAGSILTGSASAFAAVVFVMGLVLLLIEVFAPGFGIFGVAGLACIFGSIFMVSGSVTEALISIVIALGVTAVVISLIIKFLPKKNLSTTLFLSTKLDKEGGFSSSTEEPQYIGRVGVALTMLRPAGKISIDDKMIDATSQGIYIEKNKKVIVLSVEGSRLVVKEWEEK